MNNNMYDQRQRYPQTKLCRHCRSEMDVRATVCPYCRRKQSKPLQTVLLIFVGVFFGIPFLTGFLNGISNGLAKQSSNQSPDRAIVAEKETTEKKVTEKRTTTRVTTEKKRTTKTTTAKVTEESIQAEPEIEVPQVSKEFSNALKKAEGYANRMYMSKAAIYDQLTSPYGEAFSAEAANYAIENLVADFSANALNKAKSYSENMYMSKASIYDQLVSEYGEQFTPEEAQYAIDHLNN